MIFSHFSHSHFHFQHIEWTEDFLTTLLGSFKSSLWFRCRENNRSCSWNLLWFEYMQLQIKRQTSCHPRWKWMFTIYTNYVGTPQRSQRGYYCWKLGWIYSLGWRYCLCCYYELLWVVVSCCELLWIVVNCCELLWIVVNCCELLWIVVNCCELLWIVVNCCELCELNCYYLSPVNWAKW
jgi:hypothetical protein